MLLECGAVVLVHRTIPLRTRGHFAELLVPSTGSCAHLCAHLRNRINSYRRLGPVLLSVPEL